MLAEKRFEEITKLVNEKRSVTVTELMAHLNASESTIRRDLTVLHSNGLLVKVYGGALAVDSKFSAKDDDIEIRKGMNLDAKTRIAKYAASLIGADDFVYLDAGSTTEQMIDFITERRAVFVTNGVLHAKKLVRAGCKVYLIGGELKAATEAIVGSEAIMSLGLYNFTLGFWGANGVSRQAGFTTPDINEALVKQKAMERCRSRYILCDSSKFDNISPVTFSEFSSAKIITDKVNDALYSKCNNIVEVDR